MEIVRLITVFGRRSRACRDRKRNVDDFDSGKAPSWSRAVSSASSSGPAASDSPSARIANSSAPGSPDGVRSPGAHSVRRAGHRLQQLVPGLLSQPLIDGPEVSRSTRKAAMRKCIPVEIAAASAGDGLRMRGPIRRDMSESHVPSDDGRCTSPRSLRPFGLPLGGKIEITPVYPQRPPAGIGRTSTVFGEPTGRAVRVDHAVLEREGVPSAKCLADLTRARDRDRQDK